MACGKRRVTRLMRIAVLESRCKKRWRKTTVADPEAEAAKDRIQRHFGPCHELDRRYVGDITYINTWESWAYLATVIDLASRKVVRWALADHMRTELVEYALTMAFANRAPEEGAIFQVAPAAVNTRVGTSPISLARTASCCPWAGRRVLGQRGGGSFFATIKRELVDTRSWPTRADSDAKSSSTSRLVQHPPAALEPPLPQPCPVRSSTPQRRPSGGMIN